MPRRRSQTDIEFEVESFADELDSMGSMSALPSGFVLFLMMLIIIALIVAGSFGGWQLWQSRTPVYAAEDWFNAMWDVDSETVLDRTCDEEIWVSNAVASGASITGLIDFLDITQIPGLDEVIIPGVDLEGVKEQFEIDRSRIEFAEVMNDGATAVVAAQGQLRFRVFKGWYPYRLNEMWLLVQEDERWKWCGRQP